jgi:hypothetical protein
MGGQISWLASALNGKLKKLVADLLLDKVMLQDLLDGKISGLPGSGRWSIIFWKGWQVGINGRGR